MLRGTGMFSGRAHRSHANQSNCCPRRNRACRLRDLRLAVSFEKLEEFSWLALPLGVNIVLALRSDRIRSASAEHRCDFYFPSPLDRLRI